MFPSFRSLVGALKLMIATYLGGMVFAFAFWFLLINSLILFGLTLHTDSFVLALPGIFFLVAGLIFYVIQLGVWSLFLKILWSKPPQFFRVKWSRFWIDFSISVVATLPIALVFILKFGYQDSWKVFLTKASIHSEYLLGVRQTVPNFLIQFAWLWFICAACLIQWQQPKKQ